MTRIAVTGADGFLGWHLRCRAIVLGDVEVVPIGRKHFEDAALMLRDLTGVEAVIHAAGANRGEPTDVSRTNVRLAELLTEACREVPSLTAFVYANSIRSTESGYYGESKARASRVIEATLPAQVTFVDALLPNLFGELGRPNYNSFVATFCQDVAVGRRPEVHEDAEITLLHAQDASEFLTQAAVNSDGIHEMPEGITTTVQAVAQTLERFAATYTTGIIPARNSMFERQLFNQLRSYANPFNPYSAEATRFDYPFPLRTHADERGELVESAKSMDGEAQTFFSTSHPGVTRGNHFHVTKIERFIVVQGEAVIRLRRLDNTEVIDMPVSGKNPATIDIPTLFSHSITNVGNDELLTLFWTDELFDPDRPDTYPHPVVEAP